MAEGVRIRHPSERSCTFVLVDKSRPYGDELLCIPCGTSHLFKTYHLRLDAEGTVIVSQTIWEKLQGMHSPFVLANVVAEPPAQRLVLPRLVRRANLTSPRTEVPR